MAFTSLLHLPYELRDMILKEALVLSEPIAGKTSHFDPLALLLTCRLIKEQAIPILYSMNEFVVTIRHAPNQRMGWEMALLGQLLMGWTFLFLPPTFALMTKLSIRCAGCDTSRQFPQEVFDQAPFCLWFAPRLTRLTVYIEEASGLRLRCNNLGALRPLDYIELWTDRARLRYPDVWSRARLCQDLAVRDPITPQDNRIVQHLLCVMSELIQTYNRSSDVDLLWNQAQIAIEERNLKGLKACFMEIDKAPITSQSDFDVSDDGRKLQPLPAVDCVSWSAWRRRYGGRAKEKRVQKQELKDRFGLERLVREVWFHLEEQRLLRAQPWRSTERRKYNGEARETCTICSVSESRGGVL